MSAAPSGNGDAAGKPAGCEGSVTGPREESGEADGPPAGIGSSGNPRRDTYYWYYGTQVMFHMRGEYWTAWNERLHALIVNAQTTKGPLAGSWNPFWQATDRWASVGGRLYVSTMNLLSLEVYYRHLPLHEATAR